MKMLGPAAVIAACLAAFGLGLYEGIAYGLANAISLGAGSVALAAMSLCLVLAARPGILESAFGGLDRMYYVHKWLGITALGAMIAHEQLEPHFKRWVRETAIGEFGGGLGEVAYYALVALILLSWVKRIPLIEWEIPYHLWWFTHRLTGALFALALFHQLLVDMPISRVGPLSLLVNILGGIGIASYLFIQFVAARWRRRGYRVMSVERQPGATRVVLFPNGRPMRWRPGQFAFLSASTPGLQEPHPFTIGGHPDRDGSVRFLIKPLGDWTRRLPDRLRPGDAVEIEGPYGRFDFRKGGREQVWIAGGVGITPFLAWVQSLSETDDLRIHLFYSVRTAREAIGIDLLRDAAALFSFFTFELVITEKGDRLDARRVADRTPFSSRAADFFFCGPVNLRNAILKGLNSLGFTPRRVFFEIFEFR